MLLKSGSPNKGHYSVASLVLCKEVVLFGRFTMHVYCRKDILVDKLCPL